MDFQCWEPCEGQHHRHAARHMCVSVPHDMACEACVCLCLHVCVCAWCIVRVYSCCVCCSPPALSSLAKHSMTIKRQNPALFPLLSPTDAAYAGRERIRRHAVYPHSAWRRKRNEKGCEVGGWKMERLCRGRLLVQPRTERRRRRGRRNGSVRH